MRIGGFLVSGYCLAQKYGADNFVFKISSLVHKPRGVLSLVINEPPRLLTFFPVLLVKVPP